MELSLVTKILERLAPEFGARVEVEPAWGYAGRVVFPGGRAMQFVGTHLDVNALGAAAMATDKSYALWVLAQAGLPVPEGEAFFSRAWARAIGSDRTPDTALAYAERLGFPVFVKPNSGRSGTDVHCVGDAATFTAAVRRIIRHDRVFRVERPVGASDAPSQISNLSSEGGSASGGKSQIQPRDLRIVVVGDTVACAYERTPLTVMGDGRATIADLIRTKRDVAKQLPGRVLNLQQRDSRVLARLARIGRTMEDVPVAGERVQLLDNANLSSGGEAYDITDTLDHALAQLAVRAAQVVGLAFAGVDVIVACRRGGVLSCSSVAEGEGGSPSALTDAGTSVGLHRTLAGGHPPPQNASEGHSGGPPLRQETHAVILELNAAPSLAHYAACGSQQRARAEACYRQVLALVAGEKRRFGASLDTISPICHSTNVAALGW